MYVLMLATFGNLTIIDISYFTILQYLVPYLKHENVKQKRYI